MAYSFLRGDRDQPFLLPPDLRDWLPEGHLAWFILDVVDQLDLDPFYRAHRDDGHGHPAHDPKTLLGVLLYGYCIGVRSSRQLERRCHEDIAFRVQGYNAQEVTTLNQLVVAAELTDEANDVHQLQPMLEATATTLAAAGIAERPEALLADSGYWSIDNLTTIPDAPELLIPPARHGRQGKPRKDGKPSASRSDGLRAAMTAKLKSEDGKARYVKRRETVEPVFGQIKHVRATRRLLRRGLRACDAGW